MMNLLEKLLKHLNRTVSAKGIVLIFSFILTSSVYANPSLNNIAAGQATVQQTNTTTTVNQTSQKAILNWNSFNIHQGEHTHFQQPAGGMTLNRISPTQGASSIYGRLTATGQIILINPAGIFFGPNAYVHVGGLIATTHNITDENFLNGTYQFNKVDGYSGAIVNQGQIIARDHGLVALVGNGVSNEGKIQANLGKVVLGSGEAFTMSFAGNDMINFSISAPTTTAGVDRDGRRMKDGVRNTGSLIANGGSVMVHASAARGVLDNVINMEGVAQARSVSQKNGVIIFGGDPSSGVVRVAAKVDASSQTAGKRGGKVKVTGHQILVDKGADINVSGDGGGGDIYIGGNYQGKGPLPNAKDVILARNTTLNADAITKGDGGNIIVWGDNSTQVYGDIFARGGMQGGNGGFVETSAKNYLDVNHASIDLTAPYGNKGTWLLDPTNIYIAVDQAAATGAGMSGTDSSASNPSGPDPITFQAMGTPTDSLLLTGTLNAALGAADVIVTTTSGGAGAGNITVVSPIAWAAANSLTLSAANNIIINNSIQGLSGSLILSAANAPNSITTGPLGTVNVANFNLLQGQWHQVGTLPAFNVSNNFQINSGVLPNAVAQFTRATGGAGTTVSPYVITDIYGLQGIASTSTTLNRSYILANSIDASVTSNWNNGTGFVPIGDTTALYNGTFNGNNFEISNLYINRAENSVGLFGETGATAQISNIGLLNADVTGSSFVGALIGTLGTNVGGDVLVNAYATGRVTGANSVGGLVGFNRDTIIRSYSGATVSGTGQRIGGLVGYNNSAGGEGVIQNAYAYGTVTGTLNSSGNTIIGGLVGDNLGTINNSYSTGLVSRTFPLSAIGGLVGANTGSVTNSFWDTTTSGQATSAGGTGLDTTGMKNLTNFSNAGWSITSTPSATGTAPSETWFIFNGSTRPILMMEYNTSITNPHRMQLIGTTLDGNYTIANNINASATTNVYDIWGTSTASGAGFVPIGSAANPFTGSVSGSTDIPTIDNLYINRPTSDNIGFIGLGTQIGLVNWGLKNAIITGQNNVGAFVGSLGTTTTNGGNLSRIASIGGNITGLSRVGGLVGDMYGQLDRSFATGTVTSIGSNQSFVGGAIGRLSRPTDVGSISLANFYATANVTAGDNATAVGGLIGSIATNSVTITNTFATGNISVGAASSSVGGLLGSNSGTVNNSYWNTTTSGQATSAAGTGLTDAQMKSESSFGYNFSTVFGIIEGNSYPYLRFFYGSTPRIISGTSSGVGSNQAIHLAANGTIFDYGATYNNNAFYFLERGSDVADNTPVLGFLTSSDLADPQGNIVFLTPGSGGHITDLTFTANTVTVGRDSTASTLSNNDLFTARGSLVDNDILFSRLTPSSDDLNVLSGINFQTTAETPYNIDGSVFTTNGSITFNNNITLIDTTPSIRTFTSGNITFNGTIDGTADLTVAGPGIKTFNDAVGSNTILNSLTTNVGGSVVFGSGANSVDTIGAQYYLYGVSLLGDLTLTAQSGVIELWSTLNGGGNDFTLSNTTGNNSRIGGTISNLGSLTKTGSGLLTLEANNTYSGSTNINGGTLSISSDGNLGAAPGVETPAHLNINNGTLLTQGNFTLNANRGMTLTGNATWDVASGTSVTYNGIIAGGGSFIKNSGGTLTIGGNNTYTGSTTINAGTFFISSDSNLGAAPGVATADQLVINNSTFGTLASFTLNANRGVSIFGTAIFDVAAGTTLTYNGIMSGTGFLHKNDAGTLVLGGANTYTGATHINGGTLSISNDNNLGAVPGVVTPDRLVLNDGTLQIAGVTINPNRGMLLNGSGGTISTTGNNIYDGIIAGTGALTKTGTGVLTLGGNNTYSGATNITAGTLSIAADANLGTAPGVATAGHLTFGNAFLATTESFTLNPNRGIFISTVGRFDVLADTTLAYDGVIAGNILSKSNDGTLLLGGANTYTGQTQIDSGTLRLSANNVISDSSLVNLSGTPSAIFDLNNFNDTVGAISGGDFDGGNIHLGSGTLTLNGSGTYTYSGVISGTGNLVLNDGVDLFLDNTSTYTGTTTLNNGSILTLVTNNAISNTSDWLLQSTATLNLDSFVTLTIPAMSVAEGIINVGFNAALTFDNETPINFGGSLLGSATGTIIKNGSDVLTLSNALSVPENIQINEGTLRLGHVFGIPQLANVTVNNTGTFDVNNLAKQIGALSGSGNVYLGDTNGILAVGANDLNTTFSGSITGNGDFYKVGAGTLTLSGNNTYTGTTNINEGTLFVTNANALGSGAAGTTVTNATLLLDSMTLNEALTLRDNGTLQSLDDATVTVAGPMTITNSTDSSIINAGLNSTMTMTGDINGDGVLLLNADSLGGTLNIQANIGDVTPLEGMTVYSDVVLGRNASPITINTTGVQWYTDGFQLAGSVNLISDANYTISGNVDGTHALHITGPELSTTAIFGGNSPLLSFTMDGDIFFYNSGAVTTVEGQNYNGNIRFADNQTLTATNGDIHFGGLQGDGFGFNTLTVNADNVFFNNAVNASGNSANLYITADNAIQLLNGTITTNGEQEYTAQNMILGANSTLSGSDFLFNTNINADNPNNLRTLTITHTGGVQFNQNIGNSAVLESLTLTPSGGSTSGIQFTNATSNSVTTNGNQTFGDNVTVASNTPLTLTSFGGNINLDGTLASDNVVTIHNGGNNSNIDGVFSGGGSLVKEGAGTLFLRAVNTYTGSTTVNEGTLQLPGTIADSSGLDVGVNGDVILAANQTLQGLTGEGGVSLNGFDLIVDNASTNLFDGIISGIGTLTKIGIGNLQFSNINTYTGLTNINVGTLTLTDSGTLGDTTSGTIIGASGILNIAGANLVNEAIVVNGGDIGSSGGSISDSTITLNGATDFIVSDGSTLSIGSIIDGTGPLNKDGNGTLELSGINTYTGNTAIAQGTLSVVNDGTLGDTTAGTVVNTGATLNLNNAIIADDLTLSGPNTLVAESSVIQGDITLATDSGFNIINFLDVLGVVNGAGTLTKTGTGTLTLNNANTYTNGTIVNAGTINLGNAEALGTGALSLNTGTALNMGSSLGTINNDMNLNTATIFNSGTNTLAGDISLTGTNTTNTTGNLIIDGIVSGAGGLMKTGSGTLTLTGVNTYAGSTSINAGMLQIFADYNLGSAPGIATIDHLVLNGGTLLNTGPMTLNSNRGITLGASGGTFQTGNNLIYGGIISGPGALTKTAAGILQLTNTNTYAGLTNINNGTVYLSGSGTLGNTSAGTNIAAQGTLFLANVALENEALTVNGGTIGSSGGSISGSTIALTADGTFNVNNAATLTVDSIINGTGALHKEGTGLLVLTSANTYEGLTNISQGTLRVDNAGTLGDSTTGTTVHNGATLSITGGATVDDDLTLNGTNALTATTGTINGDINLATDTAIDVGTSLGVLGVISGTGALTKTGLGTLQFYTANTYSGATNINSGTLALSDAGTLGDTSAGTTIGANGILALTGVNLVNEAIVSNGGDIFGNSGSISGSTITMNSHTDFVVSDGTTLSIGSVINGTGPLNKDGNGTLELSGVNTYTGNTAIAQGTLRVINDGTLGDTSTGTVVNTGATLSLLNAIIADDLTLSGANTLIADSSIIQGDINLANDSGFDVTNFLTVQGVINGNSALTKTGTGTLTLNSANNYDGGTIVNAGTINIGNAGALGIGDLTLNTGTALNMGTSLGTINNNMNLNDATIFSTIFNSDTNVLAGDISLTGSNTINATGNISLEGEISGTGGLVKVGSGTLALTAINNYEGSTSINGGTLQIAADNNLGAVPGAATTGHLVLNGGTLLNIGVIALNSNRGITLGASGGTFETDANLTYGGIIAGTGTLTKNGVATLTLTGNNTYSGATTINDGALAITSDSSLGAAPGSFTANHLVLNGSTLQINASTTLSANRGITLGATGGIITTNADLSYGGTISGSGALTKTGAGDLALSNVNTYSGATNINTGTLTLSGTGTLGDTSSGTTIGAAGMLAIADVNLLNEAIIANGGDIFSSGGAIIGSTITMNAPTDFIVSDGATFNIGSVIEGSGPLLKDGNGTLELTGINTYTGNTAIAQGTLRVVDDGTLGDTTTGTAVNTGATLSLENATIADNLTLSGPNTLVADNSTIQGNIFLATDSTFDVTNTLDVLGVVSGNNALTKTGAGTLSLSNNNTYTDGTNVNAGILNIGHVNALGTGTLTLNAGSTFGIGSSLGTIGNNINSNSATILNTGTNVLAGGINLNGANTINTTGDLTLAGFVSGTGGFEKTGIGSLTLTDNNFYSGATILSEGTLIAGNANNAFGTGVLNLNGGSLQANTTATLGNDFVVGGDTSIDGSEALTITGTGTINNGFALNNNNAAPTELAGSLSGAGTLNQNNGNLILSASNLGFTGDLNLNGGILTAANDNALGEADVSVNNNTTLHLDNVNINNDILLNDGTLSVNGTTVLNGLLTIGLNTSNIIDTTNNSVDFTMANTITGDGDLTLQGDGLIRLQDNVNVRRLAVINTTDVVLDGANVTTTNDQTYGDQLTLTNNAELRSTAGNISVNAVDGEYDFTAEANTGNVNLNGVLGGNTELNSIALSADNVNLNGSTINTANSQTYTGTVNLGTDVTLNASDTGTITLGAVEGIGNDLTVNALNGNVVVGNLGSGGALGDVTLSGNQQILANVTAATLETNGAATINGDITTSGNQTYNGALTLANATANFSGDEINFAGTINGNTAMTIDGNGVVTFGGQVSVNNIEATGASINVNGGSITTTNHQTYLSPMILGADASFTANQFNAEGLNGNNHQFSLTNSGASAINSTINNLSALNKFGVGNLTLGGNNLYSGATNINQGTLLITHANALGTGVLNLANTTTLNLVGSLGAVDNAMNLTNATIINSNTNTLSGNIGLNAQTTFNSTGTLNILGTVSGTGSLNKTGTGILALNAANTYTGGTDINAGTLQANNAQALGIAPTININNATLAVNNVTLANATSTLNGATITGTNIAGISGAFNLASNSNNQIQAASGLLNITGNINGGGDLQLTGNVNVQGDLGNTSALSSVTTSALVNLDGSVRTINNQTYGSAFNLTADRTYTSTSGNILFNNRIDGSHDLSVSAMNTTFANDVGAISALNSLMLTGAATVNADSIRTIGNQNYQGAVTVNNDTTFNMLGNGNTTMEFMNGINGGGNVTLLADNNSGSYNFILNGPMNINALNVTGSTSGTSTLNVNTGQAQNWIINAANAGGLGATGINNASFTEIANLTGGAADDSFRLQGGTLSGNINGSGGNNTLFADNVVNTFNINTLNSGSVTGVSGNFSNIANLGGGNNDNTFVFGDDARITGSINGGNLNQTNTLDYQAYSQSLLVSLDSTNAGLVQTYGNTLVNGFENINYLITNSNQENRINLPNKDGNTLVVTDAFTGYINDPIFFAGYNVLASLSGQDQLQFDVPAFVSVNDNVITAVINGQTMFFLNFIHQPEPPVPPTPPTPVVPDVFNPLVNVGDINYQPFFNYEAWPYIDNALDSAVDRNIYDIVQGIIANDKDYGEVLVKECLDEEKSPQCLRIEAVKPSTIQTSAR